MREHKSTNLERLFDSLQRRLESALYADRMGVSHPGAKGSASEADWTTMLSGHLPSRYQVSKAFVIDSMGNLSDEIDIVIHDRHYSPLIFEHDGARYLPAESVYGVFEIKQAIGRHEVKYAGSKAKSVRVLERTSAPILHAGGRYPPKPHAPILAGVLALESRWKAPFETKLRESLRSAPHEERLNLGCIVHDGAFEATYFGSQRLKLAVSAPDSALGFFFIRLLARLQALGTVPAIDLEKYSTALLRRDEVSAAKNMRSGGTAGRRRPDGADE